MWWWRWQWRRVTCVASSHESTMHAALPPSSSTTFFLPHRAFMSQPTCGEPVNDSSLRRSS